MKKSNCLGKMLIGTIAVAVFALGATAAVQAGVPVSPLVAGGPALATSDLGGDIVVAAEASTGGESGPVQGTVAKLDPADPAVAAREIKCKTQWSSVDTNGDGIIDGAEVALYNKTVRTDSQAVLADSDRLPEADFIAACASVVAHE